MQSKLGMTLAAILALVVFVAAPVVIKDQSLGLAIAAVVAGLFLGLGTAWYKKTRRP